jgi:signal transduction histidine kinase
MSFGGIDGSVRTAGRSFVYVTSGWFLGVVWFAALAVLLGLSIGLAILVVGLPLLALTLTIVRWGADAERARAALVLPEPIARPPRADDGKLLERWRIRLRDRHTWRELAYMVALGPAGVLGGSLAIGAWAAAIVALAAPALHPHAPSGSLLHGLTGLELVLVAVTGLLLIPVAAAVTGAIARSLARLASWLLAPDARDALTARVRTLEHTRAGAVESADARLRRLERDLHDGAQHRLAFIAMELDRARGKLAEDPAAAAPLLLQAHEESKRAMGELRDLVRGIHPSVLADRGLDAAISGLAERTRLPVSLHITLPSRPPMAAETAAYYVVAEALTNVCKHADAQSVSVTIAQGVEGLSIEVSDDGRGGARRTAGSGLDGLAQRVEALDGSLAIDSPAGGPTTLRAVIPCAS